MKLRLKYPTSCLKWDERNGKSFLGEFPSSFPQALTQVSSTVNQRKTQVQCSSVPRFSRFLPWTEVRIPHTTYQATLKEARIERSCVSWRDLITCSCSHFTPSLLLYRTRKVSCETFGLTTYFGVLLFAFATSTVWSFHLLWLGVRYSSCCVLASVPTEFRSDG